MGKSQQRKGKRVEVLCRDWLRRVWPGAYRVGIQMHVRQPDIDGTPMWVESKSSASESGLHPWSALAQALRDRAANHALHRPVLLYLKADRKPAMVMMLADEWIELMAKSKLYEILGAASLEAEIRRICDAGHDAAYDLRRDILDALEGKK